MSADWAIWEQVSFDMQRLPVPGGWLYRDSRRPVMTFVPGVSGPGAVAICQRVQVCIVDVPNTARAWELWPGWFPSECQGLPGLCAIPESWCPVDSEQRAYYDTHLTDATAFGMFENGRVAIVTDDARFLVVRPDSLRKEGTA